ncbi:TetR/AcrR family transcriptional regulator [Microbacterium sp. kSW2-24]|uniref:TetR/AcrR family transcriptional regulator n=1 Tax=Microbacterium galbinum TaxID=2851646 RepID=UPI001FFCECAF|nr:TetR/AcrR family transcriptional regulator [Microbacterium galbinum]MCK2022696.1 TetR/AcrR family transcriptional regulator [Microbacterium galbinum]
MMTSGVRGPYAKTAAVRQGILEAARLAFAETGYRATTMKAVAERAQISQRGLVHHFSSKEELLTGVLADYDQRVAKNLSGDTGAAALRRLVEATALDATEPRIIEMYAILSAEAVATDHPAHHYYLKRYEVFRTYVRTQFEILSERGDMRSPLDPHTLSIVFTGLVDGLQTQWLYDRSVDIRDALHRFLDTVLCD